MILKFFELNHIQINFVINNNNTILIRLIPKIKSGYLLCSLLVVVEVLSHPFNVSKQTSWLSFCQAR